MNPKEFLREPSSCTLKTPPPPHETGKRHNEGCTHVSQLIFQGKINEDHLFVEAAVLENRDM